MLSAARRLGTQGKPAKPPFPRPTRSATPPPHARSTYSAAAHSFKEPGSLEHARAFIAAHAAQDGPGTRRILAEGLLKILERHDPATRAHSVRVGELGGSLAGELKLSPVQR